MEQTVYQGKENWLKNIILFLSSQTISLFGSAIVQFAMMWYITLSTESGVMMTLYILCAFIPTFILSPFSGVLADRFHRKMLIIVADGLIALATLILAILFMMGYESIWFLFLLVGIRAIGSGIQNPAIGAILPQIVPKEKLTRVNGINGSIQAVIMFISPMVSVPLLTFTPMQVIFLIDVFTAAIAIGTLLFLLKIPKHQKASNLGTNSYLSDFIKGIQFINQYKYLKVFFIFFAIFYILMAPPNFLTLLQIPRSFGDDYWRLSAVEISFSAGMIIGGGLIATWGGFSNKIKTMGLAGILMGICSLAFGVVPIFWLYLSFMVLYGVALPIFTTPANVLLQENIEEGYLGRVFGIMGMISTSMLPIGMLIFGPIADYVQIETLLIGTGISLIVLAIVFSMNKVLLQAGKAST